MNQSTEQTISIPTKITKLWHSDKRHKVAEGGRGSAKSYSIHGLFASLALESPVRILVTRETQNSLTDSSLSVLKRVIEDWGWAPWFHSTKHGLQAINGSEFIFRGLQQPDRIKSLDNIQYAIVEEAHSVTQDAIDILIPTIRNEGSEIWWIYNRDTEADPVHRTFVDSGRDDVEHIHVTYRDNRFFPDVLYQEMQWDKENDYEKYLHVWEGEPRTINESQVFHGKWRTAQFKTPSDATLYFGADWGFSQDPTALVRCFISDGALYIDYEAYGVGVDIDDTPELFGAVPGAEEWPITADSARPETISYMQHHGFPRMRKAKKGKGSVEDGVSFLRGFAEIVIHERCRHTADEFKLYSYKRDRLTGDILPIIEDKHNHAIDALRYAVEPVMLKNKTPQVTAAIKR